MLRSMYTAKGIGLAAQVGVNLQLLVIDLDLENPDAPTGTNQSGNHLSQCWARDL